ncbi:acyl-CoA dehydrogenase [Exilibacterium tricleocarpae]|uniref:Acyl-CoA dehydrogenase n=1 Tax=Exilibacterium tricleocarpae TaxID=2591008 RepID=A0A545SSS2_9GAMM|nr:MaoC family dehydratase N-terminal domain-containing protein [Exilibacterium tricleocarpae]TQV68013.1 acyl-CoA dehydrogenase [Exilibacterium tricleocarpae]
MTNASKKFDSFDRENVKYRDNWLGKESIQDDMISYERVCMLQETLDIEGLSINKNSPLPYGWHWIFFHQICKTSELCIEGHPKIGLISPPHNYPRRMWAGSRLKFYQPLVIGDKVRRRSTVKKISFKNGRASLLAFVTIEHEIQGEGGGHWLEEQDIVYINSNSGSSSYSSHPLPKDSQWKKTIYPSSFLLFRYSALTFNSHQIHYNHRYCNQELGFPSPVVHGPLVATFLLDMLRENLPGINVTDFSFRAIRPLFDTHPFTIHGKKIGSEIDLWAKSVDGELAMTATASI